MKFKDKPGLVFDENGKLQSVVGWICPHCHTAVRPQGFGTVCVNQKCAMGGFPVFPSQVEIDVSFW